MAFTFTLNTRYYFDADEAILFDVIISDVTNDYDVATGVFTVPYNGTYDLTLRTMTVQNTEIYTHLMINDQFVCKSHGKGSNLQVELHRCFHYDL